MFNRSTCFKNPKKPSCIDLILTNCSRNFQNPCVIETGVKRLKARVGRLEAGVARLKERVSRLKALVEAIKPQAR